MAKTAREKFKVRHNVFDEFTNRTIFKLISQGHFSGLIGPVSIGKESNVFSARTKDGGKVIVKIYRLESCDFNRMYSYIRDDPRFLGITNQRRQVIFKWCQREYRNLLIARGANVRAPLPITFSNNVLVIEFIGNEEAALKLKDALPEKPAEFFNEVIDGIRKLYKAGFVHGDLSQFNILNHKERPVFIDFSHCAPLNNMNAQEYFKRDLKNICIFFRKLGLEIDEEKIKNKITKNKD